MPSAPNGILNQVHQSLTATRPPWSVFLDPSALNLPSSLWDATTRIAQNLTHFRFNYSVVTLVILFASLLVHPVAFVAFLLTLAAWIFLYLSRDWEDPIRIGSLEIGERLVLVLLVGLSVGVLVWSHVWGSVLVSVSVGAVLTVLHAVLRSTDDLIADGFERSAASYANLLSDDDYDQLTERA